MINRGIKWFEERASFIWKNDPAKSILTIVPHGYDADEVAYKITSFIEENFVMRSGDENYTRVVLPIIPDRNASAKQFVDNIIKLSEKRLERESSARSEEDLHEKMEAAFGDLLNNKIYPILLIKRFHSFTRINDRLLLPILGHLRELERENKVTSIVISPMNYDVIRNKLQENPGQTYPFLNSPYGDNHERVVAEPLQNNDFIKYANSLGICEGVANDLFSICGGPDKIYEVLISKKLYGTGSLIDDCLDECSPILKKLLTHCEIDGNSGVLTRLANGELSGGDVAHLKSKDLRNFLLKQKSENSFECSSEILQKFILSRLQKIKRPIFERSIKELLVIDENQEIEFKETFFNPTKLDENGKNIKNDIIKLAAIKEITGFLNSNDGTLVIGVADGKNTETKKPEIRGIEVDNYSGDDDKYCRDINTLIKNSLGQTAASFVNVRVETIDGKKLCRINCKKSSEPVYCSFNGKGATSTKDVAYVRTNADTEQPKSHKAWHDWLKKYFPNSL